MSICRKINTGVFTRVISSAAWESTYAARRSNRFPAWVIEPLPFSDILPENTNSCYSANLNGTRNQFIAAVKPFNFLLHLQTQACG